MAHILLGNLFEVEALAKLDDETVFLEARKRRLLVVFNLFLDGGADFLGRVEAKVLLGKVVVKLRRNLLADSVDLDLDGLSLLMGFLAVGVGLGPGDFLLVADVHTDDGGLKLGGDVVAVKKEHAVFAGKASCAIDVLDVDGNIVALCDRALFGHVLEAHLIAQELVDLEVDFGIGGLFGRHIDGRCVVGAELGRRPHGDGGLDDIRVAVLGKHGLGAVGDLADGHKVKLFEHEGFGLIDELIGGLGAHGILAKHAVDDGARRLALAEALEVVLSGDVLVGLLDGSVDVGRGDGDGDLDLVVDGLGGGDSDLQRSSSVSWAGVCPLLYLCVVRAKGLEPSRGQPTGT